MTESKNNGKISDKPVKINDVKVEDILQSLGGFSRYQIWASFALTWPQFTMSMIVLSPVFTGSPNVPIYCKSDFDQDSLNVNSSCFVNCTPTTSDVVYSSIVQEWDLTCSKAWIVDCITSCQMAGMMTGAFLSSLISDIFGRKKCFVFQTACMGFLGMLPAAAFSPWSYAVARFLAGFGCGACFVIYLSHMMEFLTPSWRTISGTISFWPIGEMLLGLLAYLIKPWRILTVIIATPVLLLLLVHSTILESPRWLLVRKRTTEAHQVFATIAKWNGRPAPDLGLIKKLQENILREESASVSGIKAVKMIMQNGKLMLNLAILTLCITTCGIVYYGVSFNAKNLSGNPYMNLLYMGLFDLFGCPSSIILNNFIGRRKTFQLFMTLAMAFIISLLIISVTQGLDSVSPTVVTVLCLCGRFWIVGAWCGMACLTMEIAPTNLRSTCLGVTIFAAYLAAIFAPQVFLLSTVTEYLPYVVLGALTLSSSIASYFLRETLQQPLEDTMEME